MMAADTICPQQTDRSTRSANVLGVAPRQIRPRDQQRGDAVRSGPQLQRQRGGVPWRIDALGDQRLHRRCACARTPSCSASCRRRCPGCPRPSSRCGTAQGFSARTAHRPGPAPAAHRSATACRRRGTAASPRRASRSTARTPRRAARPCRRNADRSTAASPRPAAPPSGSTPPWRDRSPAAVRLPHRGSRPAADRRIRAGRAAPALHGHLTRLRRRSGGDRCGAPRRTR